MAPSFITRISGSKYIILAANDLGMHCIQPDYSTFMILPPGNNLRVQVFEKGHNEAKLITQGITVEYEVNKNTTSSNKTNFWQYAGDYGFNIPPDVGITGNKLKGICMLSKDKQYFEATAIPVVPYNDGLNTTNPYQTATITVRDKETGEVLVIEDKVVLPVSDEMNCSNCHGRTETDKNILRSHDRNEGTRLLSDLIQQNNRHSCNECHKDNILGASGRAALPALSLAVHGFHAPKMGLSKLDNPCYNCHPGQVTKCSRGVMAAAGLTCSNINCHGSVAQVAQSQKNGREAWLEEPNCGQCHGKKYSSNLDTLYRNSYLMNGPNEMNGFINCIFCHNGPHAEWPSMLDIDNIIPVKLIGKPDFISKCTACHEGKGKIHGGEG